jgi:hypothetical protein
MTTITDEQAQDLKDIYEDKLRSDGDEEEDTTSNDEA